MKWEDLKIYKPLKKGDLKSNFRELGKLVGKKLEPHGFMTKGRKFYRLTNDLIEVIELDYRGSWSGQNEFFDTNLGLIPYCWQGLTKEYYPIAKREIKELSSSIKNHYRITQEYQLLADYLYRMIVEFALPYFDKYNSTEKIVERARDFKYKTLNGGSDLDKSNLLVLFSELKQHKDKRASKIIIQEIDFLERLSQSTIVKEDGTELSQKLTDWENPRVNVKMKNWAILDQQFEFCEAQELERLKIQPAANII